MPGLLSQMFDGGQHDTAPAFAGNDDGGNSAYGTSGTDSLDGDAHLNPTVSLHTEQGGAIETPDGTTHSWDNEQDVDATVDAEAVFGLTHSYAADNAEG